MFSVSSGNTQNEQDSEKEPSKENVFSPWHFLPHDIRPEKLMCVQTQKL